MHPMIFNALPCVFNLLPFVSFQGGGKVACVPVQICFQEVKICVCACVY